MCGSPRAASIWPWSSTPSRARSARWSSSAHPTRAIERIKDNSLAPELKQAIAFVLQTANFDDNRMKQEIDALFPPPPARNDKPLPPLAVLLKSKGDADARQGRFQRRRQMQHLPRGQWHGQGRGPEPLGNRFQAEPRGVLQVDPASRRPESATAMKPGPPRPLTVTWSPASRFRKPRRN